MKKRIVKLLILICISSIWVACKHEWRYDGGEINPFISNFDLRKIYKGVEVKLSADNMRGATSVSGIVVSDHSGKNLPAGLLILQNSRRVGINDSIRGIAIQIGNDNYAPGDSVHVNIVGGVLKRLDGLLQVTGIPAASVTKVATGRVIPVNRVPSSSILSRPGDYESTLVAIVKAGFDPIALPSETYLGDKIINDGFADLTLHTEPTATFANSSGLNFNANYFGIVFNEVGRDGKFKPHHRIRTLADVRPLSAVPDISPILVAGYLSDPEGTDANYEYIQFLATREINFVTTPYSVVVCNNSTSALPAGYPTLGWATGTLNTTGVSRTYKLDLTSGSVKKGEYFYIGGTSKMINGSSSTDISSLRWIKAHNYNTTNGDGIGLKTGQWLANGNAVGIGVFLGTTIDVNSAPVDVIFITSGGSIYNSPSIGYKIANTDFYDIIDPITLNAQPYYLNGSNTLKLTRPSDQGIWNKLGGIYNEVLGKWVKARTQSDIQMSKTSTLSVIEGESYIHSVNADNIILKTDTIRPTKLKSQIP